MMDEAIDAYKAFIKDYPAKQALALESLNLMEMEIGCGESPENELSLFLNSLDELKDE